MKSTIDMAREAGLSVKDFQWGYTESHYVAGWLDNLKAFEAIVRADEREQGQKWFDAVTAQHKADIDRAFSAGLAEGEKLAIEAAAPVQEPVAQGCTHPNLGCSSLRDDGSPARWGCVICGIKFVPKSAAQRQWVGLTQQDIDIAFDDTQEGGGFDDFSRAIEAKLKEKNT